MVALAMLLASVVTGTALAADGASDDTVDVAQSETAQTASDDGESNDVTVDGDQADANLQDDDTSEAADGETADEQDDGRSEEQDPDSQPSVQSDDAGIAAQAVADCTDCTVQGVSPRGTTINVFDYWIRNRGDSDDRNWSSDQYFRADNNSGINANHVLKFSKGAEYQSSVADFNKWTRAASPYAGIVEERLGVDGYPVLNADMTGSSESLAYLFNSSSSDGKAAYTDVDGLLQVDNQGYYYYNSQQNFAEFNDDGSGSGSFTLYNTWGVTAAGSSPDGQFFPFNTGDQVFNSNTSNGLRRNSVTSTDSVVNHYFGLSMSTRFVQQYGGYTAAEGESNRQQVTYNFSGDDDVWVYIDGVLVGDLGGIHDKTSLEINFATGRVYVYADANNNNQYDQGETVYNGRDGQTLAGIMRAAGVTSGLDGATLADDTYHTLDFFYLERGNTDSNMSLKYNLVNIPESGVLKVDQSGRTIEGVGFELYKADESYNVTDGAAYYMGRTGTNGELVFTTTNDAGQEMPVTLEQLEDISPYWVLRETDVPEGYRDPGDIQLRFEDGVLLSSNAWSTGAWSQPHVTATAPAQVQSFDGSRQYDLSQGVMFAVVFQKGDSGAWYPVSGNAMSGWRVADGNDNSDIIEAAQRNAYQFVLGSGGAYEVDIENLPGDITTYEYVLTEHSGNQADAKYTVRYYYCSGVDSVAGLTANSSIVRIQPNEFKNYRGFDRVFSVTLNVANIKNELSLVKTDAESDEAIGGVTFTLYADADGDGRADGDALSTLATDNNGTLQVYSDTDHQILSNGRYVLVETAPDGYVDEHTTIRIVVDNSGVYADAGNADDNVTVETSVGSLVASMRGFAADDDVDATLHDVQAQPQTADYEYGDDAAWNDIENTSAIHYHYNAGQGLAYQPTDGNVVSYTAISGWSRLNVTQCTDEHEADSGTLGDADNKQDIKGQSLNALFTGDVTINVTNHKPRAEASFSIAKTLDGRKWEDTDKFSFTVTLDSGDAENVVLPSSNGTTWGTETNPVAISSSTKDHTVSYGPIVFTQTGTYEFTVEEVEGDIPGVSYSNAEFTVTVEVTNLAVDPQVTVKKTTDGTSDDTAVDGTVTFTNYYRVVSSLPLTGGDATARNLLLAGGGVLLLAGAAWLLAKRRRV